MDKISKSVQELTEDYVQKISTQIPIKKAILFGSYAKGRFATYCVYYSRIWRANWISGRNIKDGYRS